RTTGLRCSALFSIDKPSIFCLALDATMDVTGWKSPCKRSCLALCLALALGLILGAPVDVWCQITVVTLAPSTSPSSGEAGLVDANLIVSNAPSGAADPALINVPLQPATGFTGPSATTQASEVVTITGSTRRITFRVPASLGVGVESPTGYSVS